MADALDHAIQEHVAKDQDGREVLVTDYIVYATYVYADDPGVTGYELIVSDHIKPHTLRGLHVMQGEQIAEGADDDDD